MVGPEIHWSFEHCAFVFDKTNWNHPRKVGVDTAYQKKREATTNSIMRKSSHQQGSGTAQYHNDCHVGMDYTTHYMVILGLVYYCWV